VRLAYLTSLITEPELNENLTKLASICIVSRSAFTYDMQKPHPDSHDYRLTVTYESYEDLDNAVYELYLMLNHLIRRFIIRHMTSSSFAFI